MIDFAVEERAELRSAAEVAEFLCAPGSPVRLCGSASSLARLPAPRVPVRLASLAPMDRIVRLEPGDLTCSVEPGVRREDLDRELAKHRLVLPCPGEGTIGGLLARGEHQPLAPGALAARSVVLGLEGVLTDGTAFKAGARVVKSVAGFDLHRAFVGSRGLLFAATLFHLKLRPAPLARMPFRIGPADPRDALTRFDELRALADPPSVVLLVRARNGSATVAGVFDGADAHVRAVQGALGLRAADAEPRFGVEAAPGEEVVDAVVPPSALARVFAALPVDAPACASGTGQIHVALPPPASDALLAALPALGGHGEVRCGTSERRGRATPLDEGAARLQAALRKALDPRGILQ